MDSISLYEKREALKRLLQSRYFAKARRVSRFLEFVCEQAFLGNAEKLNEYLIGVEIYERGADFDPQQDAIVRVQAHEIRRRLKEYYQEDGRDDPLRVDFPAGHYVPVFFRPETSPLSSQVSSEPDEPMPPPAHGISFRRHLPVIVLSLTCVVLSVLLIRERYFTHNPAVRMEPSLPESMTWFWKAFLPPADSPLIVIPNHPLLRAAHEGDSPATLAQSTLIPKEKLPDFRNTIHFRELKGFYFVPSMTDFTAVGEALGLMNFYELFTRIGMKVRVKESRLVDYETVKRGNAILLGGNQAWSGRIFVYPEGFLFHAGVITNKNPRRGEMPVYKPEFDPITNSLRKDYALVLMLANERKEQRILLIYGIYTQGSQAAIEYLTSEERLAELRQALVNLSPDKKTEPKYFQVLLQTTVENYVPGKASFVSARIIPDDLATGASPL
ncbi:MAG TPA: hypothetical protein VE398_09010 [Acidobacteriota bacterium]|nr:hypothetical protein [Acidobacteriota bacterium]